MKRIIGVIIAVTLFSCSSEKRLVKLFSKYPDKAAELCASNYPAQERYIKGDTIVTRDTTFLPGDSVECPKRGDTVTVKVQCPPNKIITKTVMVVDTVKVIDNALVLSLSNNVKSKGAVIHDLKDKVAHKSSTLAVWRWISIALTVALLGMMALLIFRK